MYNIHYSTHAVVRLLLHPEPVVLHMGVVSHRQQLDTPSVPAQPPGPGHLQDDAFICSLNHTCWPKASKHVYHEVKLKQSKVVVVDYTNGDKCQSYILRGSKTQF